MKPEDPHTISFNLSSNIGSTTRIPILFPQDYEFWALHFEDYILGIEDHDATIWQAMTQETFTFSHTKEEVITLDQYNTLLVDHKDVPNDEKDKLISNIKALKIIRFALPPDTFRLTSSFVKAKEIWDRLKELYSSNADLEHFVQTLLLSEFGAFVQNPEETLDQTFNCFNHLLSRVLKHKIKREPIEQKVTFMNGLRSEWKVAISIVKAHEQFKNYTLAKLVGILKSHESEVTKDGKIVSIMGSLALIAKGKKVVEEASEYDLSDCELSKEDFSMMVSNPKKFAKNNFGRFKNQIWQGNHSSDKARDDSFKNSQKDKEKQEKNYLEI